MKPFRELSRCGRLRRLRKMALVALQHYGMEGADLSFTHSEGNVIFRVDVPCPVQTKDNHSPYVPNRYNLRILSTRNAERVESELIWLTALSREAGCLYPSQCLH
jgi:hypothetical protein